MTGEVVPIPSADRWGLFAYGPFAEWLERFRRAPRQGHVDGYVQDAHDDIPVLTDRPMALDHYVSQVHLRQFNSPALGGSKFHGIRKHDQFVFPCSSRDVCRVDEGSTNSYLVEPRAIEEFLKTVEPAYNEALAALREGRPDRKAVHVIAGFTAYVAVCSPTAIRLQTKPLEGTLDVTAELLERRGGIPPPPPELGGASWSEVRASGAVKFDIDGKYPQAIGIANVVGVTMALGNGDWEILLNPDAASNPFLWRARASRSSAMSRRRLPAAASAGCSSPPGAATAWST